MISPELPEEAATRVPERTLREFAGLCLLVLGGLFALSWYRHQHPPSLAGWIVGALAVLIGVPGLIRPNSIRPVYLLLLTLTKPIGHVVGLVLLAVVYFGVMTPMAFIFRLAGRDGLGRRRWGAESYWVDRVPSNDVRLYLRQYQHQVADKPESSHQAPAVAPEIQPAAHAIRAELAGPQAHALQTASEGST